MSSTQPDRGEEGLNSLERGAKRYRDKNYESALEAFNEAVSVSTGHILVTALDHRAATYEKMSEYKKALKDSKAMIEEQPTCSKGYLRSGKILELWEKPALALQIYELGLKRVKVGEDNKRPMLQGMYAKLRQKQKPEETFDPLVMLPPELAEMVAQYLDMRSRVLCLCVSNPWKKFLEGCPKLWTNFDTRKARRPITLKSLKAFLHRANGSVEQAYVSLYSAGAGFDTSRLTYLLKHSKKLSHLEIVRGGFVGELLTNSLKFTSSLTTLVITSSQVHLPYIKSILNACPQMVTAEFKNVMYKPPSIAHRSAILGEWPKCKSLEKLCMNSLEYMPRVPNAALDAIMAATPNIRHFHFNGWTIEHQPGQAIRFDLAWPHLETLNLDRSSIELIPQLPPTLRHLYLVCTHIPHRWPSNAAPDFNILPNLETLSLSDIDAHHFVGHFIQAGIESGTLKTLQLAGIEEFIPPACESVEALGITYSSLDDSDLRTVVRAFPNLRRIDFSQTQITGSLVREILTREENHVVYLRLYGCDKLSPDALEYARSMGVVVDLRQGASLLGR